MADIGKAPEGFPRIMQAARALAGLTIDQLAQKLTQERGLGARSLRDIESGAQTEVPPSKRRAILVACDMPPALGNADIWWLQDLTEAMDGLPDELLESYIPHELIANAFKALAEQSPSSDAFEAAVKRAVDQYLAQQRKPDHPRGAEGGGEGETRKAS